ncbi:MAG: phosphate acyltransferase, partial [Bacteroidales bacterium]|nr:phosphate acyltransferase [Bacteroidales bacterium]
MELLEQIKLNARKHNKRIVLPEGTEERTLKAADAVIAENLARITLLGDPSEIRALAGSLGLKNIERAAIINPADHPMKGKYIDLMLELRKSKGLTRELASKLIEDPLYLGVMMIKNGDADGEVAGARNTT